MFNKKNFLLILILCISTSMAQNTNSNNYFVTSINNEEIKNKEQFYKELFNTNKKVKKATIVSSALLCPTIISYLGIKYWNSNNDKNTEFFSEKTEIKKTIENVTNLLTNEKFIQNMNIKNATRYGFNKGIKKGTKDAIVTLISLSILYVIYDILTPIKNALINFFKSNDKEIFQRSCLNLSLSLKQLQTLFVLESNCYKEEIIDHYNFFIENSENYFALIKILSTKKIDAINNYSTIQNEQKLMYKNITTFSKTLNVALNQSENHVFNNVLADQISENFKLLKNQIFRFIKLANTIIYEN